MTATELPVVDREHVYGWRRPLPGMELPRADTTGLTVAPDVDPRKTLPPVFDQGRLGSCTANATAAVFQYDAILDGHDPGELSRLFIYYYERRLEGTLGQGDTGAIGHDAFRVARHGIPAESLWPYEIDAFQEQPPPAFPRAYYLRRKVAAPAQSQIAIQQALSNRQPVTFGFTVYESFEATWKQPGVMPVPDPTAEQILGGHQVVAVGYLADWPQYVLCRNSWGVAWGLGGYFLMPWQVLTDATIAADLRTIVRPAGA